MVSEWAWRREQELFVVEFKTQAHTNMRNSVRWYYEFKKVPTAIQPLIRKLSSAWCRGTSTSLLLLAAFCSRINFKFTSHLTYHTWENTLIGNTKVISWWLLCPGIWRHITHYYFIIIITLYVAVVVVAAAAVVVVVIVVAVVVVVVVVATVVVVVAAAVVVVVVVVVVAAAVVVVVVVVVVAVVAASSSSSISSISRMTF